MIFNLRRDFNTTLQSIGSDQSRKHNVTQQQLSKDLQKSEDHRSDPAITSSKEKRRLICHPLAVQKKGINVI